MVFKAVDPEFGSQHLHSLLHIAPIAQLAEQLTLNQVFKIIPPDLPKMLFF
jgi:hypothetical protein